MSFWTIVPVESRVLLIAALAALCLSWALPPLFWVVLLLSVGMYHGSYDVVIIDRLADSMKKRVMYYAAYAALALMIAALWWMSPALFLIFFVAETVIHFGSEDRLNEGLLGTVEGALRGTAPLAMAAAVNPGEVRELFAILLRSDSLARLFVSSMDFFLAADLVLLLLLVIEPRGRLAACEVALIGILFILFPPIPAFSLYFISLHALRHMRDVNQLIDKKLWSSIVNPKAWLATALAALPLIWAAVAGYGFQDQLLIYPFLAYACLTFPHSLVQIRAKKYLLIKKYSIK